jgi:hypothetical protein
VRVQAIKRYKFHIVDAPYIHTQIPSGVLWWTFLFVEMHQETMQGANVHNEWVWELSGAIISHQSIMSFLKAKGKELQDPIRRYKKNQELLWSRSTLEPEETGEKCLLICGHEISLTVLHCPQMVVRIARSKLPVRTSLKTPSKKPYGKTGMEKRTYTHL